MGVTRLRYIAPLQCGFVLGILYAVITLVAALIFLPFFAQILPVNHHTGNAALFIVAMIPLGGLIEGFILGLLMAWLYNITVKFTGGIQVRFEEVANP